MTKEERDKLIGNMSDSISAMRHQPFSARLLKKTSYSVLSPQKQQAFNRSRAISILALYGFRRIQENHSPTDTDLVIAHQDGQEFRVRVRSRPGFWKEHVDDGILICCRGNDDDTWYLYSHDLMLSKAQEHLPFMGKDAWRDGGCYHFPPPIPAWLESMLEPYKLLSSWK